MKPTKKPTESEQTINHTESMKDKQINAKVIFPTLGHTVLTTGKDVYRDSNVEVIVHVGTATPSLLGKALGYAYYEFYDVESSGDKYYAEGSLEIDDGKLVDYDGVGSLPNVIMDILRDKLGVDVSECYDDFVPPNKYEVFKYRIDGKAFDDWNDAREYINSLNLDRDANRAKFNSIQEL